MADNFTLATFITSWKEYQDHLAAALTQLTDKQLALRAASELRSVGENALHIVGCRMFWFTEALGEDGGEKLQPYARWNQVALEAPYVSDEEYTRALQASYRTALNWPRESTAPGASWRIGWRAGTPMA